jgi:hypothetical protein
LCFEACDLTEIPPAIARLTNLESLALTDNNLKDVLPLCGLSNLKNLSLDDNKLTEIPSAIGDLNQLVELNLGENNLATIPTTIGKLTNLTRLYLSGNRLTAIPSTIGELTKLEMLILSENELLSLPVTIGNLARIRLVNVSHNSDLVLETDPNASMYSTGTHLVFRWNWSTSTHKKFPSDIRSSVRLILLESQLGHSHLHRTPKDVILYILSFLQVEHSTQLLAGDEF